MGAGSQFLLLLWKNWLLQKRKVALTVFEIILPALVALLLFGIKQLSNYEEITTFTTWGSFTVDQLEFYLEVPGPCANLSSDCGKWKIAYTPNNTAMANLMTSVESKLDVIGVPFADETSLQDYLTLEEVGPQNTLGGIVFTSSFPSDTTLADQVTYKIRLKSEYNDWSTNLQFVADRFVPGPSASWSNSSGTGYLDQGFLALQRAMDLAIINYHNSSVDLSDILVQLQRLPYPPYINDGFIAVIGIQLPLLIMLSFIILAPSMVKDIVLEKEKKLKESMKLMGLSNWLHWLAWFLKYLIFLTISCIIMSIMFKIDVGKGAVISQTDGSLVFFTLFLYSIANILFCFAISVFFSGSNTGAAAGAILFFLTYVPYFAIPNAYDNMGLSTKLLSCLLPNVGMAMGFNLISSSEVTGVGIQWSNIATRVNQDDELTLAHIFCFFLIDAFIAFLITWYVDAVKPGDFGVPKPFYFPFTKWYWCGGSMGNSMDDEADASTVNTGEYFEAVPENVESGIRIKGLRKVFKKNRVKKVAVDNLYLNMAENEITALLGHNGAGKSTTMFMLTGFLSPTKGTAAINGMDIRTDIDSVRQSLGLCPQHDVLFDTLTVAEHLEFFARLKGVTRSEVKQEVQEMIKVLHLESKTNTFAKKLSGGMKRKLSVGIALIGDSKIVILDEPTSGMDPEARRQTWDILQSQRAGRTILLSTHFMDEADYLGDRIAIMAEGKLVCCGSSLFLKKKYGVGYHMIMVKEPNCNQAQIDAIIKSEVPDAKLESNISAELTYVLPHESSQNFESLFTKLETNRGSLGISSFGASVTTMEEVFLKVGEGENENLAGMLQNQAIDTNKDDSKGQLNPSYSGTTLDSVEFKNGSNNIQIKNGSGSNKVAPEKYEVPQAAGYMAPVLGVKFKRNSGLILYIQQFWAMFLKRFINSWRSPVVSIVQLVIPMLFALIICIILRADNSQDDPEALTLTFSNYEDPIVAYDDIINGISTSQNTFDSFKDVLTGTVTLNDANPSGTPASTNTTKLETYLGDAAQNNLRSYLYSYIMAGYFEGYASNPNYTQVINAYFQGEALHSLPVALNVVGNTLLRYVSADATKSIEVTNHPIPLPARVKSADNVEITTITALAISINVVFGMSFLVATFVVFPIKEKAVKAKHCQFVSGVHTTNFWFSAFAWDLINFMIPAFGIMILFAAFDIEGYVYQNNLAYVFLTFLFFGMSILPFVYVFSFLFDVAATGFVWTTILNIFSGIGALVAVFVLKLIESTQDVGDALQWVFYAILPNFCFSYSLQEIYTNYQSKYTCDSYVTTAITNLHSDSSLTLDQLCAFVAASNITNPCCPGNCGGTCAEYSSNYLRWESPGIGKPIVFMSIQFVCYFALLFFLESGLAKNIMQKIMSGARMAQNTSTSHNESKLERMSSIQGPASHHIGEDSDVHTERQRLLETDFNQLVQTESLIITQIKKFYGDFLAVDGLTVGIQKGECFGLLGVNGAGKTTTFKMLTGDETITSGKAYLDGHSVITEIKQVQQKVGYCPQFDALIEKMTVAETLSMYARLRGVSSSDINSVVKNLISNLLLEDYTDKQAGTLSGGNKRKLSTAIALVGDPPVVFLDEPTTGMDPVARRLVWNTLTQVRESGRTLVLTSHSMEECEALCTRIAIMVNGQFKCLGACQKLKSKFGEGYTLMAKVSAGETSQETQARTDNVREFIDNQFPGSTLKDLHQGLVMYQINSTNLSWAKVFGTMERAKEQYHIEDYSVSQTTLEQVFINFARAQIPPLEEDIGCGAKFSGCCKFVCCCGCCSG